MGTSRCVAFLTVGTRDVHEIEMLGRSLGWTEQGWSNEASDKHRQGIERGLDDGQQRSSQTRGSRARRGRAVQEIGGDAELHELGQVRCVIRREGRCTKYCESDTGRLEETEEGRQIFERSG